MLASFALACFALVPFAVNAQSANPALELQAITAAFTNSKLVPDLLQSFSPIGVLGFSYGGKVIPPGTPEAVDDVKAIPTLTLTAGNSTAVLPTTYTLAMVDPGAVGSDTSAGQTRHWLVNGVTLATGGALVIPTDGAITAYGGPLPPAGSGPHRYVFLLYEQPATFAPTGELSQPGQPIAAFNVNEYATSSGLGAVVAASYYTVEQGTATASIPATEPVVSSTLPAAQSTAASGSSTKASTTGTGTSAQPTKTGAASKASVEIGFAGLVAIFGIVML